MSYKLSILSLLGLAVSSAIADITPDYQSILWAYNGTNYYTPLTLNTTAYALTSPAGSAPYSLSKRSTTTPSLLPCTVVTLNSTTPLTGSTLEAIVAEYESIDDVWTPDHFTECMFVQYDGPETDLKLEQSFLDFFSTNSVQYAFLSTALRYIGLSVVSNTNIFSIVSTCDLTNGPYVASLSACGGGIELTPAYTLHVDDYEGRKPDPDMT
jgi:hypothetical protein